MFALALLLFLQLGPPQREIVGPYTFRDDQGQTTRVVLKNGLTAIVREEHAVPLVGVTTLVKVGYFDEDDRVSGISRVIQHMLFQGTAEHPAGEIERETRALGGVLKGHTDYDGTLYSMLVPAENASVALGLQADALWHPSFDEQELKREVGVVLKENNRELDSPSVVASDELFETAFAEHPLKRWRLGSAESLRALTREDLVEYYQKYYQPSNIVLTVVGDVDREKVLGDVVRLYGDREYVPVERKALPEEPSQAGLRYAWRRGPIHAAHVAIGFHVPGILSEDARTFEVLAAVLGTGRSSRMTQVLRNQKDLITSSFVALHGFQDLGYFEIGVETDSPIEAATAVLAEIENIKRFGVTAETVARARAAVARNHFLKLETLEGTGADLAHWEALGDWRRSSTYLSDIQQVTSQRVMEAARKYLTFSNVSVFEYLPDSIERYLTAEDYQAAVLDKVSAAVERRNEPELPVVQIPQRTDGLVTDIVGSVRKRSILRGPDVYILEDHRLPIVSFGIFFPGGRLLETKKNSGITELMLQTALRGTRNFDSEEVVRRLENAGAQIQVINEPDFFGYMLNGLAGGMDQALQVLVEVLQEPLFAEPQVESERSLQLARVRNLQDDTYAFPVNRFMRTLFGDSSYARPAVGTEEGIGKLTGTDLREWFDSNERKILPTVVIVGDTRGTALIAPLADALTNEDLEPRDIVAMPQVQPSKETMESEEDEGWQESALVYGFPGVNSVGNDRYTLELFANIASGLGLARQGLAATVNTVNLSNSKAGAVFTYTAFSPEQEGEVRAALDAGYARLRKDGVSARDLQTYVEYTVGVHNAGLQTRQSQVLDYARAIYSGAGYQAPGRYAAAVRAVTGERLNAAISQYLTPPRLRVSIVHGQMP